MGKYRIGTLRQSVVWQPGEVPTEADAVVFVADSYKQADKAVEFLNKRESDGWAASVVKGEESGKRALLDILANEGVIRWFDRDALSWHVPNHVHVAVEADRNGITFDSALPPKVTVHRAGIRAELLRELADQGVIHRIDIKRGAYVIPSYVTRAVAKAGRKAKEPKPVKRDSKLPGKHGGYSPAPSPYNPPQAAQGPAQGANDVGPIATNTPVDGVERIQVPWTVDQVRALRAYQEGHPTDGYRCPRGLHGQLTPGLTGWVCMHPTVHMGYDYRRPCGYQQDWAYRHDAEPDRIAPADTSPPVVTAVGMRVTKLDADGNPTGESVSFPNMTAKVEMGKPSPWWAAHLGEPLGTATVDAKGIELAVDPTPRRYSYFDPDNLAPDDLRRVTDRYEREWVHSLGRDHWVHSTASVQVSMNWKGLLDHAPLTEAFEPEPPPLRRHFDFTRDSDVTEAPLNLRRVVDKDNRPWVRALGTGEWEMQVTPTKHPRATWTHLLENHGPLTEWFMGKLVPFSTNNPTRPVPDSVTVVQDRDGDDWTRMPGEEAWTRTFATYVRRSTAGLIRDHGPITEATATDTADQDEDAEDTDDGKTPPDASPVEGVTTVSDMVYGVKAMSLAIVRALAADDSLPLGSRMRTAGRFADAMDALEWLVSEGERGV